MTRKRRKKNFKGNDLLRFSIAVAIVALIAFYLKEKTFHSKITNSDPIKTVKTEAKKPESSPQEIHIQRSKALSELLPAQAWPDDYLVIKAPLGKSNSDLYLVGMGLITGTKNPDQIKDPSQLSPYLMVAKKEEDQFTKITDFNFHTQEASVGGLQFKNLRGIPRIKSADIIDLDGDGMPEIKVNFDTSTDLAEAIGFLSWNGSELNWVKTKDQKGSEKIALWLSGASSSDSQQLEIKKVGKTYEIIQKFGQVNSAHPEQGFEWKTLTWKMKNGVLQTFY